MIAPKHLILSGLLIAAATLSSQAGSFTADFNNGQLPAGTVVFGNNDSSWLPVVESGGVGDTACLKLTKNVNSQWGSFIIGDLDAGAPVYGIRATFMARIGGGTSTPADGWSFSVAPDLPDAAEGWGEAGAGNGLTVQFDTYDNVDGDPTNGSGEAPQIRLLIGRQLIATTPLLPLSEMINNAFVPVEIKMNADGSFDLTYNGKAYFSKIFFPGYQPLAAARIGFGARTGGLNANHWIDDLAIETYTAPLPGITQQPQSLRVLVGTAVTFSIAVNNGDMSTIQWYRNGTNAIQGATGTTYTLNGPTLADDGATFSAKVTLATTTVTSSEAKLGVVQIDLPASPLLSYDFNGAMPNEATVYGGGTAADGINPWGPYINPSGGVNGTGILELTEAVNWQSGAFIVADQHAGAPVYGVAARFDVRIGGGSEVPADGMSFNFGADLPDATSGLAEEGVGSGLNVCFDIYDNTDANPYNGVGEAPAITLKWGGKVVGESKVALSDITTGDAFADVIVRLTPDGLLDVAWNGKVLMYRTPVPGFGSISSGRFGFYARTGGLNANQWVDNLRLYTYMTAPLRVSKQPAAQAVLVGKPATFNVEVTTPTGTTYQWFRGTTAITGATDATYTTPATVLGDDGATFKVECKAGTETVVSDAALLTVVNLTVPTTPPFSYDFNSGQPAGTDIGGSAPAGSTQVALIDSTGGVDNTGVLKLTTSENSQVGGFRSALIQEGAQLLEFTFAADVLMGNGITAVPADGFSINLANDVPVTPTGDAENGAGTGITIAFDTYDNDDADPTNEAGEAPSIDVRYKGQVVATQRVPLVLLNSGAYQTVLFRIKENGLLDLAVGDTVVYHGLQITNYAPMSGLKLALYARTGGANASYWFDNVRLAYTLPAAISIISEPADALVLVGQTATFQVQVNNPQGVTYQWKRNTTQVISGATQPTYTTPALGPADDGARYSVVATGPGNTVTSREAVASVMTKFDAGTSPAVNVNFDDGFLPLDSGVFGTATLVGSGGVGNTPFVQLTDILESQNGSFLLNAPAGSSPIYDFTATWMMRVGGGTDVPADGFSFVLGPDIADGPFGEDGVGSGLIVSFDTYRNPNEMAPEITIRYANNDVVNRLFDISVLRTGDLFKQIGVRVNRNGTLDLYYGDTAVYRGVPLPGYTPFTAGRFGWGARTGGLWDYHWVDDIKMALNTQPAAGPTLVVTRSAGNITLTWSGGGTLWSTTALPGGWTQEQGATSGYTVPATGPARFYRVQQ